MRVWASKARAWCHLHNDDTGERRQRSWHEYWLPAAQPEASEATAAARVGHATTCEQHRVRIATCSAAHADRTQRTPNAAGHQFGSFAAVTELAAVAWARSREGG